MSIVFTVWTCGALPMAVFLLAHAPPKRLPEWLAFVGVVIFWPAFLAWCATAWIDS